MTVSDDCGMNTIRNLFTIDANARRILILSALCFAALC